MTAEEEQDLQKWYQLYEEEQFHEEKRFTQRLRELFEEEGEKLSVQSKT